MGRVLTLDAFGHLARQPDLTLVQCHGVFDLLHLGHIRHLEAARALGDCLVVTLTSDRYVNKGPGRPAFSAALRAEQLAALACVDYVAISDHPSAEAAIAAVRPAIYVKGHDYTDASHDPHSTLAAERRAVEAVGGRLHLTDELAFSSSRVLNDLFDIYPAAAQGFLRDFRSRHAASAVLDRLRTLHPLKVLVLGEAILDEYVYVQGMQRSPKELLIPTRYLREEVYPGGSLACAAHVRGFCDRVDDLTGSAHTVPIRKRRYVEEAFLTKMFEVQTLPPQAFDPMAPVPEDLGAYDVVIAADYGHGFFDPHLMDALARGANFLALTVQSNSANLGYNVATKWPRADYLCLDEPEARLALREPTAPIEELLPALAKALGGATVTVTRGHHGSLTLAPGADAAVAVPALSREVTDRVGAGDAYLSVTALGAAVGWDAELLGFVGNATGALAVRTVGNRTPVSPSNLFPFIVALLS